MDPLERFMAKVEKLADGCWAWTGASSDCGASGRYGSFYFDGKVRRAHRVSLQLHRGIVPAPGEDLDHLCRNTLCVNPDHIELVPHAENVERGAAPSALNARKTHCLRGHEFSPENTVAIAGGRARQCRACRELRNAMRRGEQWAIDAWERRVVPYAATRSDDEVMAEAQGRLSRRP